MTRRNTLGRWAGLLSGLLAMAACTSESPGGGGSGSGAGGTDAAGGDVGAGGNAPAGGSGSGAGPGTGSGAGAGVGGSGDSGGSGGGEQGGGCGSALFCDDFEAYGDSGEPGGAWSVRVNDAVLTMDTTRAFSGTKSVKVSAAGGSGKVAYLVLGGAPVFPVEGNHFFGRMRVWLESTPADGVNWNFIEGEGVVPGAEYRAQYRYGGQHAITDGGTVLGSQLKANYETPDSYGGTGPGSDCWKHADKVVLPVADWVCVEWEFDGPNDTMRLWLDGAAVESATMAGRGDGCVNASDDFPWTAPTFQELHLGWQAFQAGAERTLWIDDVALSTERVGCTP